MTSQYNPLSEGCLLLPLTSPRFVGTLDEYLIARIVSSISLVSWRRIRSARSRPLYSSSCMHFTGRSPASCWGGNLIQGFAFRVLPRRRQHCSIYHSVGDCRSRSCSHYQRLEAFDLKYWYAGRCRQQSMFAPLAFVVCGKLAADIA